MDKETYEKQKAFAGEKKPSMLRRCVGHDYTERRMYMVTMVTEGRQPLFGTLVGDNEAEARVELSALGQAVSDNWFAIPQHFPQIEVIALQMMPDHLHGILFVREKLEKHFGQVLSGFKAGCNKDYRRLVFGVGSVVAVPQQKGQPQQKEQKRPPRSADDRNHGLLFARGYNDKLLLRAGQLEVWKNYLRDNPRRLFIKRHHPDLFRVQFGLQFGSQTYSALGNRFLLSHPFRRQVQCSRKLSEKQIQTEIRKALAAAAQGAVHVSPAISPGEKAVMRTLLNAGFPLVFLEENGLTPYTKPGNGFFQACANGQLLILAPWEHHNEQIPITRNKCLVLNELAKNICNINTYLT